MLNREMQFLVRWFGILTVLGAVLPCCGSVTQSKNENLALRLAVPDGEDPALFWFGVAKRTLTVTPSGGDATTVDWKDGGSREISLRAGDKLTFQGADEKGRLLVEGEAVVGEEKSLTIPLRRVL